MQTTILPISDNSSRETAHRILQDHGVIIAPTDTVYGIMCRYDSAQAVERLFAIKQRPLHKAIPILIGSSDQLPLITEGTLPPAAQTLAAQFWPGPLTLVLPARDGLPPALTAGGSTVGVRMPDHAALRELMRSAGPLAATSANRSGDSEACTAEEALAQLGASVPLILSDDDTASRPHRPLPSTVVDLAGPEPTIIRTGPIADEVIVALQRGRHAKC